MDSKGPIENEPSKDSSRKSADEGSEPKVQIPPTPGISQPPPPKTHCEITCKQEKNFWDHVKTGIEIIGIILLAVYTGYTIKMYCANKKAADAARDAADTATKTMHMAYRPRIEIRGIGTLQTLTSDQHFKSMVDLVNYAPITARNVRIYRFDDIIEQQQAHKLPYEEVTDQPKIISANTVYTSVQNSGLTVPSHTKVSQEQWRAVKGGTKVGIISVLIVYEDDFSVTHHAEYCTFFENPGNGPPCPWPVQND